ncbi:MAG TPA: MoxR family ATPase [Jatrophihabitans sp.]|nr:MoxR family ATPase [Jatrophihabitans sp.]
MPAAHQVPDPAASAPDPAASAPDPAASAPDPAASAPGPAAPIPDPAALAEALRTTGYLPDDGLATAAYLALRMHRPLFLEGDAGVGKTSLAQALAEVTGAELVRLQCYEGIDAAQALYDWDFARQILHLRAAESAADPADPDALERSLYSRRFLIARPILRALEHSPSVLLIDEIDRADDEFEAFLLEVLADNAVSIPELGTIRADRPPVVVLTSNRTREVHDALKRRCLYHWVAHPSFEREVAILRRRLPEITESLAREVARAVRRMREVDLLKPPGVAESIDWAQALQLLGARSLDPELAAATLGAVLKYQEDAARIRDTVLAELAG